MLHLRNRYAHRVDEGLLDATEAVLIEHGFDGVSLERVAERADRSRVTLWRQGVTKDTLVTGLLQRLTDDFVSAFWPVLNAPGNGRRQLEAAIEALFEVADRHLDLLAVSDQVFHWAAERCEFPAGSHGFLGPFIGALRQGAEDGSLAFPGRIEDERRRRLQHRLLGLRAPAAPASVVAQAGPGADRGAARARDHVTSGCAGPTPVRSSCARHARPRHPRRC